MRAKQMNINIIDECVSLSLGGKITFPEVVAKLMVAGVERYLVDLITLQKTTYGIQGESHVSSLSIAISHVALVFDAEGVKQALHDIQQNKIDYQAFLHRIATAGCSHYEVYIAGKKVIYFGRDGSQHIEFFPKK